MPSEIRKGDKPALTSLVGASAMPSQAPAASPDMTPRLCREPAGRCDSPPGSCDTVASLPESGADWSVQPGQDREAEYEYHHRNPELEISENRSDNPDRHTNALLNTGFERQDPEQTGVQLYMGLEVRFSF